MSAGDPLCPSKMYSLLIVFHQSVQEEWITGQAVWAALSVSHATMEGKPARQGGDREGAIWSVIVVVGLCNIGIILLIYSDYFMWDFSAGWFLIFFKNIEKNTYIGYLVTISLFPSSTFSYLLLYMSFVTLSLTNLSCNVKRQKGNLQGSVSAVIKRKAATSTCRQLWSTALFDQSEDIFLHS